MPDRNNYRMSPEGIDMLVEFEGEILKVYKDPVGLPTFGVGHLVKPGEKKDFPVGKKISRATSRAYLREDLKRFEDCVNNNVKVPITQNQFDALVSLAFNIGESAFKRSSVLRNLNNRQFDKAADSFRAWNKAGGKVLSGLVRRRATERSVFLTPDPSSASVSTGNTIPPVADVQESGQVNNPLQPTESVPKESSVEVTQKRETTTDGATASVEVTQKNEQSVDETVTLANPEPYQKIGFWGVIKRDLSVATGGNLTFSGISEYAQQASGWPPWVVGLIGKIAVGALIVTLGYFIFRVIHYFVDSWKQKERIKLLATINTDVHSKDLRLK